MRLLLTSLVFMVAIISSTTAASNPTSPPKHYNIVFFGATGDLAQKYLWKGLYSLFQKEFVKGKVHFTIYGVGRTSQSEGRNIVGDILLKSIVCYDDQCRKVKTEFVQAVQYHALKTDEDYKSLSKKISENTLTQYGLEKNQTSYESGRLFYMSIPPNVVVKTVKRLHEHLLPEAGHPWVRVVLEKPFGKDKKTAQKLAKKLSELFIDEQIYRVDHYLGKPIVRLMLPFRYINRELYEPIWNRRHVERVEIVMKEKLDCTGRVGFYDDVGVVRDVMQNHLTELLLLAAMDLPHNSGNITEILEKKLAIMRRVKAIHRDGMVLGQYAGYKARAIEELAKPDYESLTPTFAATVLSIDSSRWRGVPFVLMSGKQLDEKASYVRVVFKDDAFCVQSSGACGANKKKQVVFHVASGAPHRPALILISPALPKPKEAQIWQHEAELKLNEDVFGEPLADMHKLLPAANAVEDAYAALLSGAFHGQRHLFTTADVLMASWDVWTPVVQRAVTHEDLRIYDVNKNRGLIDLNIRVSGRRLQFETPNAVESAAGKPSLTARTFRGSPAFVGNVEVIIEKLARELVLNAQEAVAARGHFHVALSGGSSPLALFKYLAEQMEEDEEFLHDGGFPWSSTHVWQVDERCVSADSVQSNMAALNTYLLRHLHPAVGFHQVHPIPVNLRDEPCQDGPETAHLYETAIRRAVPDGRFDYVLLGVGTDGHTASLFPHQPSLNEVTAMSVFVPGVNPQRVSLSFKAINQARAVGVLVTGAGKKDIVRELQAAGTSTTVDDFPILGVQPTGGNVTFYIDKLALDSEL